MQSNLLKNINDLKYTKKIRKELYESLMTRFGDLVENDLFKLSTFLDPSFGIEAFEYEKQNEIKKKIKQNL